METGDDVRVVAMIPCKKLVYGTPGTTYTCVQYSEDLSSGFSFNCHYLQKIMSKSMSRKMFLQIMRSMNKKLFKKQNLSCLCFLLMLNSCESYENI